MSRSRFASRLALAASAAAMALAFAAAAPAQQRPADLTELPAVPTDYTPGKTAWGDWDFAATYQIEYLNNARVLFQRPKVFGERVWLTDEEFQRRIDAAERSDANFSNEGQGLNVGGTQGLADWLRTSSFGHRTSMLVSPSDGQLPPLTPEAEKLYAAGRSGWVPQQEYDWVTDFDSWDRCVSRGFPASMFPFRYNNGIRIFQAPGYVVLNLEMLGTRVIPLGDTPQWPGAVEAWMGDARGHWEGKTLVIETSNIKSGDSATYNAFKRAAGPLNMATQNVPAFNTIPTSARAHSVERLTMTGPGAMTYEITYDDPEVFTKPWTARLEWIKDDSYEFFEYACHEGNRAVRGYIQSSRAHRAAIARGEAEPETAQEDSRTRFAGQFDYDPAANDRPAPPGPPPQAAPPPRS